MLNRVMMHRSWTLVLVLGCVALSGCGSKAPLLMPTPNLYTHPNFNPFADIPPVLQGNRVQVLYVTDRSPQKDKDGNAPSPQNMQYGRERSRSAAFGVAEFQIGDDNLTWDELVRESRAAKRDKKLEISVASTRELGRFAPTPPSLIFFSKPSTQAMTQLTETDARVRKLFLEQLNAQLAKTPRKEVYLFIHGFNVDFDGSIQNIGELWHFLGREGVPMAYSWPAGQGTLRAYEYTNQSAHFTIYHLKQTLRLIASCPAVEKVHIIAHSRGTAVATDAVRELVLEIRGKGDLKELKLGTAALCAADLDFDVVIEQNVTARAGEAADAIAIYAFKGDKALAFSNWLSGGVMRLGDVHTDIFNEEEIAALRSTTRLQLIDARITKPGAFGHSYFHENPAVSSDLILLLRFQLPPGGESGRPLKVSKTGFWIIDDDYPGSLDAPWFNALRKQSVTEAGKAP
jgi:esterase/lipase superfamily enzyme